MDIMELIFCVVTMAMCVPLVVISLGLLLANILQGIVNKQELKSELARREARKI